jgi:beta-glucanase (GH16 family)
MSASRVRRLGGRLAIAAVFSALLIPQVAALSEATSAAGAGSLSATRAGAQAAVPAAKPKQKSSWKTVRTEEFSGSALPDGCEEYTGKNSAGKNAWSKKDVNVSGGLLQLKLEKKKTSGQPYTSGAIGCWGAPQKYGRYEIKAKVPVGKGIDSSLTLFPVKIGKNNATEFTGMDLLAPGPETAYITNGYGTKAETARVTGKYSGDFHTYLIEWAPKHIRMAVDGKEIYYSNLAFKGSRWLGLVVSNGDALAGVPSAGTKLPARLQIDRIKISSYTGVPPKAGILTSQSTAAPTTAPTGPPTAAAKVPATTGPARLTALDAAAAETGPALAGGVWPWLLGGSVIAVLAIASLNYPRQRRLKDDERLIRTR